MRCPYCRADEDKVVDSRSADGGGAVRRRRECLACGRRFTTHERIDEVALLVRKRSGHTELFDPTKLFAGLDRAVAGGAVDRGTVRMLVTQIEEEARAAGPEVSTEWIGRAVLERLRVLDAVSYLRFASVYKGFEGIADFEREFVELQKTTAPKPPPAGS